MLATPGRGSRVERTSTVLWAPLTFSVASAGRPLRGSVVCWTASLYHLTANSRWKCDAERVYERYAQQPSEMQRRILLTPSILTYSMRVLLEKLTGSQLIKKFSAFYGTRKFTTAFTRARHLSLTWASSIQSIPPNSTSWRPVLIQGYRKRWTGFETAIT